MCLRSRRVPILSLKNRSEGKRDVLLQLLLDNTEERLAMIRVIREIAKATETESPVQVTVNASGLMTIGRHRKHKTTDRLLPAGGIQDVRPHRAFLILVTKCLKEPVLLNKHTVIAVGTELPSTAVILRRDDTTQVRENGETDDPEQVVNEILTINDLKRNPKRRWTVMGNKNR